MLVLQSEILLEGCIDSHRGVAQPGRALRSGRRGRWFKSSRPDSKSKQLVSLNCGELFLVKEQRFALFSRLVFLVQSIPRISTRRSQSRVVTAAFSFRQFRVRSTSPRTDAIEGNFIAAGRIEQWAE